MKLYHSFLILFLAIAGSISPSHANTEEISEGFVFQSFDTFEFILENYAHLSYDIVEGKGAYLDALYSISTYIDNKELYLQLKAALRDSNSITEFVKASVRIIEMDGGNLISQGNDVSKIMATSKEHYGN